MSLFAYPQIAYRNVGAYDADGIWQASAAQPLAFLGTIQPANSQDVRALPQGRQYDGAVAVFSTSQLRISRENSTEQGDTVRLSGISYELVKEDICQNSLVPHYRYVGVARDSV